MYYFHALVFWLVLLFKSFLSILIQIYFLKKGTNAVCMLYMKETVVMFIGGIMLATAVEHCNLHTRIALKAMKIIGCSQRK